MFWLNFSGPNKKIMEQIKYSKTVNIRFAKRTSTNMRDSSATCGHILGLPIFTAVRRRQSTSDRCSSAALHW